jgi:hypothetical protein
MQDEEFFAKASCLIKNRKDLSAQIKKNVMARSCSMHRLYEDIVQTFGLRTWVVEVIRGIWAEMGGFY